LEIERPAEFAKVWEPQHKLLTKILTACSRAGLVRKDLSPAQLTTLLNSTLTSLAQIGVFHVGNRGADLTEDHMWAWCLQAVSEPVVVKEKAARTRTPARSATSRRAKNLTG
jgi:hypothetical protein